MNKYPLPAKVFISCGQSHLYPPEQETASEIKKIVERFGFDAYLATHEQTLESVNNNLFRQLETSEYFLFVDFKREKLKRNCKEVGYRGSLYTHQELAVACYLFMKDDDPNFLGSSVLLFGQKGVEVNGVLACAQGNIQLRQFETHKKLLEKVKKTLKSCKRPVKHVRAGRVGGMVLAGDGVS